MKILITGGAGYIGSVVTEMCIDTGDDVVIFDDFSTGHREAVDPRARLVAGDVGDAELLAATFRSHRTEAVIHMAGFIEAGESMRNPGKYFLNNSCRPLGLLEAMRQEGVRKILFSSTAAVYGNPVTDLIKEDHPQNPANAYGESKLLFEKQLDWYDAIFGIRHAALRYFNAAGAYGGRGEDHRPESHLIPLVLQAALGRRECAEIYGTDYPTPDGTCIRDYIHVRDLAQAHLLALGRLEEESFHFNLGNGLGYSVRQVIETAREVTGIDFEVRETGRRAGDPAVLVASSERISEELGWRPEHPGLEEIVASAWEWHRTYPDGYGWRSG
ncbi:MAG: UDP-glucose 4-epimerase GalE [Thermoleophilia bacterium]|nr:UDP-glucose 4-epimerase GalE [Thermoleophilia bacterium]